MHLTMNIEYILKEDKFNITGDIKEEFWEEIVTAWVASQIGAGHDPTPMNELDVYHITIEWNSENDSFNCHSDTGSKGLREGILSHLLSKLWRANKKTQDA